jgi:membrane protein
MAAALSYYLFLAAIPGLLLFLSVGSYVLGSGKQAEAVLAVVLQHIFPEAASTGRAALEGAAKAILAHRGVVSGVSTLALLWTGMTYFDALQLALNNVWHVAEDRPFHLRKLHSLALVLGAALLAWVSFGITTGMQIATAAVFRAKPDLAAVWLASQVLAGAVAVILASLTFTLLYIILPNRRVSLGPAALGAVIAAALWELAKIGFNRLMVAAQGYQPVYGSTAKLVVALVWLYVTSALILLGAHLAAGVQLRAERGRQAKSVGTTAAGRAEANWRTRSWVRWRRAQPAARTPLRVSGRGASSRDRSSLASASGRRRTEARPSQK